MRGGHSTSGPPPDPDALRRERDKGDWTNLPAVGRQGEPPAWPLARPRKRELALWAREWARPQAVVWEANGQQLEVALYVRNVVDAEQAGASAAVRSLVQRQMDALGLTGPGLARNRWIIDHMKGAPADAERPRGTTVGASSRSVKDRFKLLEGGERTG